MATDENGEAKAKGLAAVSHAVIVKIIGTIRALYDRSAPWLTLVDARKFACPEGVGDALHRFRRNTNDFGYNYCLVLLFISVGCVVTKPFSLIVIACLLMLWAYVFYVRAAEATFRGFTFTLRLQGVILFLFSVFVLLVATDVSQLLTGGLTAGCFACAAHAVMRTPEALPDDGEKGLIGGFTDFVSSSISSNAAAFDKVGDMIPVKWAYDMNERVTRCVRVSMERSQQMDGVLGKIGLNL